MDKLDEIRQRTEAAKAQKEKGDSITAACIAWSIVANDIPYLLSEVDRLNALHKREIIVTGEYAQRVIKLTARAEAAETQADAAVKDMAEMAKCRLLGTCTFCKHRNTPDARYKPCKGCEQPNGSRKNFEWRGPQEAGKGDAE